MSMDDEPHRVTVLAQRECYAGQASSRTQGLVQSEKVRLVRDRTQDDRDRYGRLLLLL